MPLVCETFDIHTEVAAVVATIRVVLAERFGDIEFAVYSERADGTAESFCIDWCAGPAETVVAEALRRYGPVLPKQVAVTYCRRVLQ